jgi:phospholipid/cholesterol/gamma-HCH transport system substrate-binding protein
MTRVTSLQRTVLRALVAVVALVLVAGVGIEVWPRDRQEHLTVDFTQTVSLYPGSTVRILGVAVGKVDSVQPLGTKVRVRLSWDSKYALPSDVHAVIVSPAIVGDRFVQLTPAYDGGARLADDSFLDQSKTAVPVELDQTYAALDQLATALGPAGANKDGALSRVIANGAHNLKGQGAKLNHSITALSQLTGTFADNKDELFDSITKLSDFVSMLNSNDSAVRSFNSSLAEVSQVLAGERTDLSGALSSLAGSLGEVKQYVAQNRSALRTNIHDLAGVTKTLARQKKNLAKVLTGGPEAITHLIAAYNPASGTLDTRGLLKAPDTDDFSLLTNPTVVAAYCGLAAQQDPDQATICYDVGRVIQQLAAAAPTTGGPAAGRVTTKPGTGSQTAQPGGIAAMMAVTP